MRWGCQANPFLIHSLNNPRWGYGWRGGGIKVRKEDLRLCSSDFLWNINCGCMILFFLPPAYSGRFFCPTWRCILSCNIKSSYGVVYACIDDTLRWKHVCRWWRSVALKETSGVCACVCERVSGKSAPSPGTASFYNLGRWNAWCWLLRFTLAAVLTGTSFGYWILSVASRHHTYVATYFPLNSRPIYSYQQFLVIKYD